MDGVEYRGFMGSWFEPGLKGGQDALKQEGKKAHPAKGDKGKGTEGETVSPWKMHWQNPTYDEGNKFV